MIHVFGLRHPNLIQYITLSFNGFQKLVLADFLMSSNIKLNRLIHKTSFIWPDNGPFEAHNEH